MAPDPQPGETPVRPGSSYFERVGASAFRATARTSGAWNTSEQHIAPALGLLTHLVELDRDARRSDGLAIGRLSFDILGTVAIDVVEIDVRVLRPGRTVELVEATMRHGGRVAVVLRAWMLQRQDTAAITTPPAERLERPDEMPSWSPSTVWPGGFIASVDARRVQDRPGRARYWVRTAVPLLDGEPTSALAAAAGLFDIANGMTVPVSPQRAAFPNIDLTAHLHRAPSGRWLGFDTTVTVGSGGLGLTASTLYDGDGPFGTMSQCLTVRPAEAPGPTPAE